MYFFNVGHSVRPLNPLIFQQRKREINLSSKQQIEAAVPQSFDRNLTVRK